MLDSYIIFTFLISAVMYPVVSYWVWGGGWLQVAGFHDFAGSGVVHMTAGLAGLIGTIILGPRIGFFEGKDVPKTSFEYIRARQRHE